MWHSKLIDRAGKSEMTFDLGKPANSPRTGGNIRTEATRTHYTKPQHTGPAYVPGPVDGSLYAQVDKNLKKQIRSYSLDSGIHSRAAADPYEHRAHTLGHKPRNVGRAAYQPPLQQTATLNRLQWQQIHPTRSDSDINMEPDFGGKIQSIDKLLKELGECSELLDTTIHGGKKASERPDIGQTAYEEITVAQISNRQESAPNGYPSTPPTPMRRAASFDATERYQDRHAVPKKLARTMSGGGENSNGIGNTYRRSPENGTSWGGVPGAPRATSTPRHGLQQPPKTNVTPPNSGPKFYATQFVASKSSATGEPSSPGGKSNPSAPTAYLIGETVEVNFMNGLDGREISRTKGQITSDENNNPEDLTWIEPDPEPDYLPEKGNVAAKVAFLTEIVFPASPQELHPPRKGTVPMPGLVSKSPHDISDEISKYNATSLAPGELSHSTGTLYRSGVPQIISDYHPGSLPDGLDAHIDPELEQKLHAAREKSELEAADAPLPPPPPPLSDDENLEVHHDDEHFPAPPPELISPEEHVDAKESAAVESVPAPSGFAPIHLVIAPVNEGAIQAEEVKREPHLSLLLEKMKDDDEDGYALLKEVPTRENRTAGTGRRTDARPSPILLTEDLNIAIASQVAAEPGQVQKARGGEHEAIDGIMSEMADISLQPEVSAAQPESLPSAVTPGTPQTPRSPTSSTSGPFDNTFGRKRSPYHSDKGYSSTTSLSSDSSGEVFFDTTAVPGLRFDKDNSEYWYKPKITRDQAITILKDKEPGMFVVRDSQSFPGAYGLAVKVAIPPPHVLQGDLTKVDLQNEKIRHFLIESTKKGVKLKGCENEPVFGSLSAFVFQHTITPLSLPLRLSIPSEDLLPEQAPDRTDGSTSPGVVTTETVKVMFVGESAVEMLSGATAVQRTVEDLLKYKATPKFTTASFKVAKEGITITDIERKVFFRKHFPMTSILHCGIDPLDQRWDLHLPNYSGTSRTFGIVVRRLGEVGNDCHLFAEVSDDHSVNTAINLVNRYISNPS